MVQITHKTKQKKLTLLKEPNERILQTTVGGTFVADFTRTASVKKKNTKIHVRTVLHTCDVFYVKTIWKRSKQLSPKILWTHYQKQANISYQFHFDGVGVSLDYL